MRVAESVKAWLRRGPGYSQLRMLYHLTRGGELRSTAALRLLGPKNLFQPHGTTQENRYPQEFAFVLAKLGDGLDRRILSFGCSTGEEVFSLRRYFPQATIKGLDVSRLRIGVCRDKLSKCPDPNLHFAQADTAAGEEPESYDAVLAMAVFRHGDLGEMPARCDHLIRFGDFERCTGELARCLKPGGFLVIRHANFRFTDTAGAAGFETVLECPAYPGTPIYGRDNRRVEAGLRDAVVFRKVFSRSPPTPSR